jgi:hypothetical protein
MLYVAGFDASTAGLGTITLGTAGKTDVVVDMAAMVGTTSTLSTSSRFFLLPDGGALSYYPQNTPGAVAETMTDWSKVPFCRELRSRIRAGMTTNTWDTPSSFDITYNYSTNQFAFSYSPATFTVLFSVDAGRKLFGYNTTFLSAGNSHASDRIPYYVIAPNLPRVSDATPNYEPSGIGSHVVPDAPVAGYGVSRLYSPLYRDWMQKFETLARSERLYADSIRPYTFQQLFEDCRGHNLFIVYDGWAAPPTINSATCTAEVFALRNDGLAWEAKNSRASSNNNAQFHHRFMTQVVAGVGITA